MVLLTVAPPAFLPRRSFANNWIILQANSSGSPGSSGASSFQAVVALNLRMSAGVGRGDVGARRAVPRKLGAQAKRLFILLPKLHLGTNLWSKLSLDTSSAFPSQAWERGTPPQNIPPLQRGVRRDFKITLNPPFIKGDFMDLALPQFF
jgi:hypothetical protein